MFYRVIFRLISSLSIIFLISLSGCASKVQVVKEDHQGVLETGRGYLLLGLAADFSLRHIIISGETKIMFSEDDVRSNSNYLFTDLPAGDYRITTVKTGRHTGYRLLGDIWSFSVKPGKISYVGDFKFKEIGWRQHSIVIKNRSSFAYEFLQERFPNLLKNQEVSYTGLAEDRFFSLMMNKEVTKVSSQFGEKL